MREKVHLFKQEIDEIPVPHAKLDAIIANTVQGANANQRIPKRRKVFYGASAAVMASVLLISSAAVSPVMASIVSKIPIVGSIFSEFGDTGLKKASEQGLTDVIGKPQVVGDTSLTIDEVFYDGTRFSIGYSLNSEKPLGESPLRMGLSINGQSIGFSGGSKENEVSSTYRKGILEIDPTAAMPEAFNLGLSLEAEKGQKWSFTIPVKVRNDVKLVPIDHKQQVKGIDFNVTDLKVGPAGILVSFHALSKDTDHLSSYIEFKMVDETGKEIVFHSGGSEGKIIDGKEYISGSRRFDPIDPNVKQLKITPYLSLPTNGGGVEMDANGNEKSIEFKPLDGKGYTFDSFTVTLP
ncbi:DUF4179 domain-containing protein [Paenibacillus sp. KN14-4R]|uniref:DUF4179 domain-containing protein n=1 Tax=Paenibacillus sp. KN14-4R TaxID=3445773 RepID=UPI003F9F85E6